MGVPLSTSKECRERRNKIVTDMKEALQNQGDDGFTPEQQEVFDRMDKEQEELRVRCEHYERKERVMDLEYELAQPKDKIPRIQMKSQPPDAITARDKENALRAFISYGTPLYRDEWGASAQKCQFNYQSPYTKLWLAPKAPRSEEQLREWLEEQRGTCAGQTVGTAAAGGHIVQNEPMPALEVALLDTGGAREAATIIRTPTGAKMPWPTLNDTTEVAFSILPLSLVTDEIVPAQNGEALAGNAEGNTVGKNPVGFPVSTCGVITADGESHNTPAPAIWGHSLSLCLAG